MGGCPVLTNAHICIGTGQLKLSIKIAVRSYAFARHNPPHTDAASCAFNVRRAMTMASTAKLKVTQAIS